MAEGEFGVDTLEFPVDPSTLPTTTELPLGELILTIKSVKVEKSKENIDGSTYQTGPKAGQLKVGGKSMVTVQFGLAEPDELAGIPYTHRFIIGSDEDPGAKKEGTWRRNATTLMAMFKHARVGGKTFLEYVAAAPEQKVGATVKKGKDSPQFAARNEVKAFWEPGAKQVRVLDQDNARGAFGIDAIAPQAPTFVNND